jgi:galactokinase
MNDLIDRLLPHDQRLETLIAAFEREFGRRPEGIAEAPGRVNLIGEHVDYNDGLVLPFAIDRSVMAAWGRPGREVAETAVRSLLRQLRTDTSQLVEFQSADLGKTFAIAGMFYDAHLIDQTRDHDWSDYPSSIVWALRNRNIGYGAIQVSYAGDVPQGAGLSSSAAIEVAIAGAFRDAFDLPIDDVMLAQLCQRAENEYVGVQCGIMDQFTSVLSERDNALLIDCRSLAHEAVPLRLAEAGLTIVIANSAVRRELVGSAYNERRRECEAAVSELRTRLARAELSSLRDVSLAELEGTRIDTLSMRRARHVVTEIARVAASVEALGRNDFAALGSLMVESHQSLRDDYEVSSPELDLLVGLATAEEYVPGARLTGAGFGGCTVNLVRGDAVDAFGRDVIAPYRERTGLPAVMYVTSPQDGLRTWRL